MKRSDEEARAPRETHRSSYATPGPQEQLQITVHATDSPCMAHMGRKERSLTLRIKP